MTPDLASLLDIIATKAPALRDAGVRTLEVAGIRMELDPPERGAVEVAAPTFDYVDATDYSDPLNDPTTFGRTSGLPGFGKPDPEDVD